MPVTLQNLRLFGVAPKPVVAISACLNGEPVRYDGAAKSLQSTLDILSKHLELQPICPEVGAGLGVPRAPVQLVRSDSGTLRALGRDDSQLDVTDALTAFAERSLRQSGDGLAGYIFKSRSPSCGLNSTAVFNSQGEQVDWGSGYQAHRFSSARPWIQCVEETQLASPAQCEHFILRCLVFNDVRSAARRESITRLLEHYADLVTLMPRQQRRLLTTPDPELFWQHFGRGLGLLPHS